MVYAKGNNNIFFTTKIRYDAMYIILKEGEVDGIKEIDKNTIADFDNNGEVLGVEILFVKERNPKLLQQFQIDNLVPA